MHIYQPKRMPALDETDAYHLPETGVVAGRYRLDYALDASRVCAGIWDLDPGTIRRQFDGRGESIHVVSGGLSAHEDGGEPVELTPGTLAHFGAPWTGTWTIKEPTRMVLFWYREA